MHRCPFIHAVLSINCHTSARSCQCGRAGFDHLEHRAPCGTAWTSAATAAQIDALRVIAATPGIRSLAFSKIRESRGHRFRQLKALGFIRTARAKPGVGLRAFITDAGARAMEELFDSRQPSMP